jgi:hypothetical protein
MLEFNVVLSTAVEINEKAQHTERLSVGVKPNESLSAELLGKLHRYWSAANYLCVGQIYLFDNPLLHKPLSIPPPFAHRTPSSRARPRVASLHRRIGRRDWPRPCAASASGPVLVPENGSTVENVCKRALVLLEKNNA